MPTYISKINGLDISAAQAQYIAGGNVDGAVPLATSAETASYIDPAFISASAAASGFGSGGGAGGPESDPIFSAWSASAASKFAGTSSLALTASYSTTLGASITNNAAGKLSLINSNNTGISVIDFLTASLALTASSLLGSVATASYAATASLVLTVSGSQAGTGTHRIALLNPADGPSEVYYDHNGIIYDPSINRLTVAGTISATNITASLQGTASWAANAITASFALTSAGTAANATSASFASTASYLNNLNQNLTIVGNLNVVGTASYTLISASQLDVGTNTISVNVAEPAERFGGLVVYDSGSLSHEATASLFWDSLHNHWVYQNASGSTYSGGMLMSGPRNTGSLGDEPGLTKWFITRGDGGDHLNDTQIFSSGSVHIVTGSLTVTGNVIATASWASNAVTASYVDPTFISASAAASGFGSGGGGPELDPIFAAWSGSAASYFAGTASYALSSAGVAGGVTSITAGTGISVDQSTGNVTITNTGGGGGGTNLGLVYAVSLGYLMP